MTLSDRARRPAPRGAPPSPGCLAALVLAMVAALGVPAAWGAAPRVEDRAAMFGAEAIAEANRLVAKIYAGSPPPHRDVLVQTRAELPAGKKIQEAADAEFASRRINGLLILVVKSPGQLWVTVGEGTRRSFPKTDVDQLVNGVMLPRLRERKPDQALLDGLRFVDARLAAAPAPSPPAAASGRGGRPESSGTGFVVSRRGHVLTNAHVIDGCREVRAGPDRGARPAVSVVASDRQADLGLLLLPAPGPATATFREGAAIRPGDSVVAVGYPLRGLLASAANVTAGTVSALAGIRNDTRYLQMTAPVQPGNSGGPLLDQSANVVGIIVAKLDALRVARATGDIPQNVNFAIHASVARAFLDSRGVSYESAPSTTTLATADVGERAMPFTLVVECFR